MDHGLNNGLPSDVASAIPPSEKILWIGKPDWKSLAYHAFFLKYLLIYLLLAAVYSVSVYGKDIDLGLFFVSFTPYLLSGVLAGSVISFIAFLQSKNTVYVLTEKRIIIRSGIALIFLLNAPLKNIESIDRQFLRNGCGNISFSTTSKKRIPFLSCWPSVRPWSFISPKPAFRSVPEISELETIILSLVQHQKGNSHPSSLITNMGLTA